MADKGFKVCAYNRTTSKVDDFMANEAKGEFQAEEPPSIRDTDADALDFPYPRPQARTS